MESLWTTKKRWFYKIEQVLCSEGSSVLNHAFEEEALDELGKEGWEVFKIEKNELSIPDYDLRVYCKKEVKIRKL